MAAAIDTKVNPSAAGTRLDRYLTEAVSGFSRSQLQKTISGGGFRVNGAAVKSSYLLKPGDHITGEIAAADSVTALRPEAIALEIVFEDRYFAVINKPAGMAVHPGAGRQSKTLVNALLHRFPKLSSLGGPLRPGLVHRLDRETSGLLIVAKTDKVHQALSDLFRERKIQKTYRAIVWGHPPAHGKIDRALGRSRADRTRWRVDAKGRAALTEYTLQRSASWVSELLVFPKTGRTHQIRVHLASAGFPVVGDRVYGGGPSRALRLKVNEREKAIVALQRVTRHLLHAEALVFVHPNTRRQISLEIPPPTDYSGIQKLLFR